jgi:peptidoglycan/LPS O-acetylase OafA/YrhL
VVLTHFDIPGFEGGMFAVDIFFVLSGFLITLVLNTNVVSNRSLGEFYWRRFLRLTPALAALCTVFYGVAWFLGFIPAETVRDDLLASVFSVANWTRAGHAGAPMYLGNCWSLAIEEQFYLIWPLVFIGLWRYEKNRLLLMSASLLFLVSMSWRTWLTYDGASSDRILFGFDTHCDGLLLGCILGLSRKGLLGRAVQTNIAKLWPIAAISAGLLIYGRQSWNYIDAPIINASAAVLVLAAWELPNSMFSRFLKLRPLVITGKISYGLYLWNTPIALLLLYHGFPATWSRAIVGIPLCFVVATLSYVFVELPALRLRGMSDGLTQRLGMTAAACSFVGMVSALAFFFWDPVIQYVAPQPIIVTSYGPHSLKRGETFNVQPNGQSCMWMVLSHFAPANTTARIGIRSLETHVQGRSVGILLPPDILERAGTETISLIDEDGSIVTPPISLMILE